MIGRVKPILNVLEQSDHRLYRAHYCGICAATKKTYGRRAAMGHSSEMVLVSMILEGLAPDGYEPGKYGCTVLPLLPRKILTGPPRHSLAVAAGVLASLQLDLKDARSDGERRIKRFLCRSHAKVEGEINPETARHETFVREAIAPLPADEVGEIVAGVIGSVFQLAGMSAPVVATGCRIGHTLGRLMNLSDAVEDFEADRKAGRFNAIAPDGAPPEFDDVEEELHAVLDELGELIDELPLKRNVELIRELVNVHARARAAKTLERYRESIAGPPPTASGQAGVPAASHS